MDPQLQDPQPRQAQPARVHSLRDHSLQKVAGMAGASPQVIQVGTADVDVTDLATRSDPFTVQVNLEPRIARQQMPIRGIELRVVTPQDVAHDSPRRPGAGVPQRQIEHRAQVLFELTGHRTVNAQWPLLCGRIASSLTRYAGSPVSGSLTSNISTAITPVTPSSPAMRRPAAVATAASWGSRRGAGARTWVQMPLAWTVSTTGHAPAWPDGLRTTSSASSRTKSTFCSASSPSTSGPPPCGPSPAAASRAASESQSATCLLYTSPS